MVCCVCVRERERERRLGRLPRPATAGRVNASGVRPGGGIRPGGGGGSGSRVRAAASGGGVRRGVELGGAGGRVGGGANLEEGLATEQGHLPRE